MKISEVNNQPSFGIKYLNKDFLSGTSFGSSTKSTRFFSVKTTNSLQHFDT